MTDSTPNRRDHPAVRSGRGRQAEARRNDVTLLDAARLVFALQGPAAPVSAVAEAAGIGIASLYRRYANKDELLQHLCQASLEQLIAAAESSLADGSDAWRNLTGFIRAAASFRAGVLGLLAGTFPVTAELILTAQRANDLVEELLRKAQASGAARPDLTSVDIWELLGLFSRRPPERDETTARLLAITLDGLRASDNPPLPGPAPSWAESTRVWEANPLQDK